MTDMVPENPAYLGVGGDQWDDTGQRNEPEPVVVHIASSNATPVRPAAPEFGSVNTWVVDTLAIQGKPTQILTRRYRRHKARLYVASLGPLGAGQSVQGSVTSPGANANIAQITAVGLVPGTYTVQWSVQLDGTLGAGDGNNFKITGPGLGGGIISANDPTAGHYQQNSFQLFVPPGNATALSIRSVAAGTVGAIYTGQLTITPQPSLSAILFLSHRQEYLTGVTPPNGIQVLSVPFNMDWESQQPLYATITGVGPVSVSVVDEAYQET